MRFSSTIKSLIHGVSTKALALVSPLFLKEQHNFRTDPGAGLLKRHPTEHVISGVVTDFDPNTDWVKKFRVRNKVYFLIVKLAADIDNPTIGQPTNNDVTVVEEDGTVFPVNVSVPAYKYLVEEGTRADIQLNVHGDIVFLTNRTKRVEFTDELRPTIKRTLLHVKTAPPANNTILTQVTTKAGVSGTVNTSTGAGGGSNAVNTIATALAASINSIANIAATARGATVAITNQLADEEVTVLCSHPEVVVISEEIDDITDLPRHAPVGKIVGVKNKGATDSTTVYFRSDFDAAIPSSQTQKQGTVTFSLMSGFVGSWMAWYSEFGSSYLNPYHGTGTLRPFQTRQVGSMIANSFTGRFEVEVINQNTIPAPLTLTRVILVNANTGAIEHDLTMTEQTRVLGDGSTKYFYQSATQVLPTDLTADRQYDVYFNSVGPIQTTESNIVAVLWRETSKPDVAYRLDPATMPVMLAPTSNFDDGEIEYSLDINNWDDRNAGNTENNPDPEFVGSTITATAIFQNRLIALTGTAIQTTETDNTSSFFRNTVTQKLPTHPVSIKSTAPDAIPFSRTLNHNKDLMVISDNAQYKLDGKVPLTPDTAGLPQVASYSNSTDVLPVSLGNTIFYAHSYGRSLGVSKYEGTSIENFNEKATSITDEVKGYIPTNIELLTGDSSTGTLIATNVEGELYVCDFDTELTRAEDKRYAWSKWDSLRNGDSYRIEAVDMIKTTLTMAINHGSSIDIVKMNMNRDDVGADPIIYVDNKYTTTVDGSYRINLPSNYSMPTETLVVRNYDEDFGGTLEEYTVIDPQTLELVNQSPEKIGLGVTVGSPYLCEIVPNYVVGRDEGGRINSSTSIRVLRFLARLNNSADVTAEIESPYAVIPPQEWSGLISGDFNTLTNVTANTTGTFKIAFKQRGDIALLRLKSLNHLPMNISEIEYIGNYTSRGRRF